MKGGYFMRHFQVDIRKEATKYGFMPTLRLYLLDNNEKQRPMVVIAPGD